MPSADRWANAGCAGVPALLKEAPGDFRVQELLDFEPTGAGEHLYLLIEKTGLTTPAVARRLADAHGVAMVDVGYAGMKDKHAITTQWFSVRTPRTEAIGMANDSALNVQRASRHPRKLRRGQLRANRFAVQLRKVGDGAIEARLRELAGVGAPNYFGSQRFGEANLSRACAWLAERRRRRVAPFTRALHLSVLRSFLFNEVLAARVRRENWRTVLPGDVVVDGSPTGPLWGRGRSATTGAALEIEQAALAAHASLCDGLEHAGVTQGRRRLVLQAPDLVWEERAERTLSLSFTLPAGGYATSFLGAVFDLAIPRAGEAIA